MTSYPDLGDWGGQMSGEVDPVARELAEQLAWSSMLSLAAGQVTPFPTVVRPVFWRYQSQTWVTAPSWMSTPASGWGNVYATGVIDGGIPFWSYTHLGDGDNGASLIQLEGPVGKIESVTIDGEVLNPGAYRVERDVLRRLDGQPWPTTQNLDAASGTGVFEITYYRGRKPTALFTWAVGQLAAEFYASISPSKDRKCRLPDKVSAVTRQGVTYSVTPGLFADGVTGIREIDAVLRMYNPNALKQATVVMSPDSRRSRPTRIQ